MKKILLTIFGAVLLSVGLTAQTITPIPAGGTWATARGIINANDEIASDSMAILQLLKAPLASPTFTGTVSLPATWRINAVTVTSNGQELNILDGALVTYQELNKLVGIGTDTIATRAYSRSLIPSLSSYAPLANPTFTGVPKISTDTISTRAYARLVGGGGSTDTTYLSARIDLKAPIANPNFTGVPRLATADTLATRSYARTYGGTGTVTIGDVRDEIADSLNVLRPATKVGNGTVGPFFDGTQDGGNLLYFYGSNGFWTALQGGAPTANRSYRLPIAALPSAGNKAYLNIDQYGNMGFIDTTLVGGVDSATYATRYYASSTFLPDSDTASMLTNYSLTSEVRAIVNDSIDARIGAGTELSDVAVMLTDSLTQWVTISQLVDSLAAVGGGVSIGDVRDEIADSLNVLRPLYVAVADTASMLTNYALLSEASGGVSIGDVRDEIADSLNAIRSSAIEGVVLADSTGGSGHYASWDDMTDGLALKPNTTAVRLLADTIPIFVFGAGGGNAGDTAVFTTSTIYGSFYNTGSDSLRITELRVVMLGDATDTLSVDILWDVNLNDGTPTELNADPLPVNSFTTGDTDTSFGTAKIPPGVWVWCETPGVVAGRKPMYFNAQITGYKIPRY